MSERPNDATMMWLLNHAKHGNLPALLTEEDRRRAIRFLSSPPVDELPPINITTKPPRGGKA